MMNMEVKAAMAGVIQKLTDTLNDECIASNRLMIPQLKRVQKLLEMLKCFPEESNDSDTSRDYLCVLYEVADEIEKFVSRVARQRKTYGSFGSQVFVLKNLHSCGMLIRDIKKIMSKISRSPEEYHNDDDDDDAVYLNARELVPRSSSAVWPISAIPSTPSLIKKSLTRSLTTIPQPKKLVYAYSYNKEEITFKEKSANDECSEEVLALRYNKLSDHSKLSLLYLTLFPKDDDISVRRLIRLWLAEGFVERKSQQPFPEDLVQKHFENLVKLKMIQITKLMSDNSPKKCRLDPVLHDYLLPKAQDTGLFIIYHNSELFEDITGPFSVRRIVHHMSTTGALRTSPEAGKCKFDPSILRSYVSFNRPHKDTSAREVGPLLSKIIKSDLCLLRVLDLEGVNKPTLPDNLGQLSNLKYLGLRRTYLDYLPNSVGNLLNLETLDVKHTNVNNVPDSIWKLKELRHLNLNNIHLAMSPSSCSTLVTLWGLYLDEKIPVNKVFGMLLNLRELGIKFRLTTQSQNLLFDCIAKMGNLQSLRLISTDDMGRPSELHIKSLATLINLSQLNLYGHLERLPTLNEFPPSVKVLTLSLSELNTDPMETLGQLPCLIVLRLLGDSLMGKKLVCHRGGFKTLEVLKLWKLNGLEEWEVEEGAMAGLKQLDIRSCYKLTSVSSRLLLKPKRLDEIILKDMPDEFAARIRNRKYNDTSLTINQC